MSPTPSISKELFGLTYSTIMYYPRSRQIYRSPIATLPRPLPTTPPAPCASSGSSMARAPRLSYPTWLHKSRNVFRFSFFQLPKSQDVLHLFFIKKSLIFLETRGLVIGDHSLGPGDHTVTQKCVKSVPFRDMVSHCFHRCQCLCLFAHFRFQSFSILFPSVLILHVCSVLWGGHA